MSAGSLDVEIQRAIDPLAPEWDELADRARAQPFLRPGWVSAWCHAFGGGSPEIITVRREGRLVALLPLLRQASTLRSPANWHTPEFGLLAEDDAASHALSRALFATGHRRISLAFIDPSDAATIATAADAAGYRVVTRTLERSPYLPIEGDWETYEQRLDQHRLTETRRRRRRLHERGALTFEVAHGHERLDELLADGYGVEGSGWKTQRGTAIASQADTLRFYTEVARWAAQRDSLRLAFLRLDGRPLAFQYMIEDGRRAYLLKGGFAPEFAKYAPGMLLTYDVLARAFAEGLETYEFLGAEEPFKRVWTSQVRERILLDAFARSPSGLVEWAAIAHGRPLAKRVLALRRR